MENIFVEKASGAISDTYRLSILKEIAGKGRMSCSEVQQLTGLSQPCVSHHVKILTESGLVNAQKEGRTVMLSINKTKVQELSFFLKSLAG